MRIICICSFKKFRIAYNKHITDYILFNVLGILKWKGLPLNEKILKIGLMIMALLIIGLLIGLLLKYRNQLSDLFRRNRYWFCIVGLGGAFAAIVSAVVICSVWFGLKIIIDSKAELNSRFYPTLIAAFLLLIATWFLYSTLYVRESTHNLNLVYFNCCYKIGLYFALDIARNLKHFEAIKEPHLEKWNFKSIEDKDLLKEFLLAFDSEQSKIIDLQACQRHLNEIFKVGYESQKTKTTFDKNIWASILKIAKTARKFEDSYKLKHSGGEEALAGLKGASTLFLLNSLICTLAIHNPEKLPQILPFLKFPQENRLIAALKNDNLYRRWYQFVRGNPRSEVNKLLAFLNNNSVSPSTAQIKKSNLKKRRIITITCVFGFFNVTSNDVIKVYGIESYEKCKWDILRLGVLVIVTLFIVLLIDLTISKKLEKWEFKDLKEQFENILENGNLRLKDDRRNLYSDAANKPYGNKTDCLSEAELEKVQANRRNFVEEQIECLNNEKTASESNPMKLLHFLSLVTANTDPLFNMKG